MSNLWVVIPVYNEQGCVREVIEEWLPKLREHSPDFTLCVLNDGSKDNTIKILRDMATVNPELEIVDKPNSGHGQTCLAGYRLAISRGAQWILQIDSDGQCNAKYFGEFWSRRLVYPLIYGYRYKREDGYVRFFISKIVRLVTFFGSGSWVKDPNVPFRLMRSDAVAPFLGRIPADFYLANIALAALQKKEYEICWINFKFRNRIAGIPSAKTFAFLKRGMELCSQLKELSHQTPSLVPDNSDCLPSKSNP